MLAEERNQRSLFIIKTPGGSDQKPIKINDSDYQMGSDPASVLATSSCRLNGEEE